MVSPGPTCIRGIADSDMAVRLRWQRTTPLAFPVVPDVKIITAGSSGENEAPNASSPLSPDSTNASNVFSFCANSLSQTTTCEMQEHSALRLSKRAANPLEQKTNAGLVCSTISRISATGRFGSTGTVLPPERKPACQAKTHSGELSPITTMLSPFLMPLFLREETSLLKSR